jgi:hypothetical protein
MTCRALAVLFLSAFATQADAKLVFSRSQIVATIPVGSESYDFEFSFKNEGDKAIGITAIKSDCDCTDAAADKQSYSPGEKGAVKGRFSIGDRVGLQNKTITVITDDGTKSALYLRLTVPELASFRPKMMIWTSGGVASSKTLRVDTAREYGARIVSAECSDKNFKVEFAMQKEHTDNCEIKVTPVSLNTNGRSELRLKCVARGGIEKFFTVHLLIK